MDVNYAFINSLVDISKDTFVKLQDISVYQKIEANTQIIKSGQVSPKVYILVSGIVRSFLRTESGKEYNKSFYLSKSVVISLSALIQQKPSLFIFETLTVCEVYEVDFKKFMVLCDDSLIFNKLYCKIVEKVYMKHERRLIQAISLNAKERYLELQREIPEVNELIPQYHIASYLGITPVQLSRIRKKIEDH